jgi:hypothetical protein
VTEPGTRTPLRVLAGRYLILERLGSGGAGVVWRAHDRVLDRTVAVKLLHPDVAADPFTAERFRAEASAAAKLTHPNAVIVHDIGRVEDRDYLVMELVEGATLADLLRDGPLPPEVVAALGVQVARALGAAHARGLVHRDVKPANVLLTEDGVAKVADFGIARALGETTSQLTRPGQVMGTARYLAPEQLRDVKIDARADVYALGLVLHQAVTGHLPFGDGTAIEVAVRRLADELPPPSARRDGVPAALDEAVRRATCQDPEQRFADGAAVAAALLPAAAGDAGAHLAERVARARAARPSAPHDPVSPATGPIGGPGGDGSDPQRDESELRDATAAIEAPAEDRHLDGAAADPADVDPSWGPPADETTALGRPDATAHPSTELAAAAPGMTTPPGEVEDEPAPAAAAWSTGDDAGDTVWPEHDGSDGSRRWLLGALGAVAVVAIVVAGVAMTSGDDGQLPLADEGDDPATDAPADEPDPDDTADGDEEVDEDDAPEPEPVGALEVVDARDHDPFGSGEEHRSDVPNVHDGDTGTSWQTSTYRGSPQLGGLKPGVGVWLDLGDVEEVTAIEIVTSAPGLDLSVYAADAPPDPSAAPEDWGRLVATVDDAQATTSLTFEDEPAEESVYLVWLTSLPADGGGFRGQLSEVGFVGR